MRYTIKKGDTLSQIAKRKGLSLKALLSMNPSITNPDKIRIGAVLNLSAPEKEEKKKEKRVVAARNPNSTPRRMMPKKKKKEPAAKKPSSTKPYTIKSGDTLSEVAKRFGTSVNTIMEMNTGISNSNDIKAGQKISIGKGNNKNPYKSISKKELSSGEFDTNDKKASRAANKNTDKNPKGPDVSKVKAPKPTTEDIAKSRVPSGRVTITDLPSEPGLAESISEVPKAKKPVDRYGPLMRKGR
jgi:LysM repeat protein